MLKDQRFDKVVLKIQKWLVLQRKLIRLLLTIKPVIQWKICYSMLLIQSSVDLQLRHSCLDRSLSQMQLSQVVIT